MYSTVDIAVVGGGASGFFAAISAAEAHPGLKIMILERSPKVLGKVRISGGGRCNLAHACFVPRELIKFYPRGNKALLGPFSRFCSGDTLEWFESRGVETKIEDDGRIFPVTDDSGTVVDCLLDAARRAGVRIRTKALVTGLIPPAGNTPESEPAKESKAPGMSTAQHRESTARPGGQSPRATQPSPGKHSRSTSAAGNTEAQHDPFLPAEKLLSSLSGTNSLADQWQVLLKDGPAIRAKKVLFAPGGSSQAWNMLEDLGIKIVPPVPSLFTFNIKAPLLRDLAGVSVPRARLKIPALKLKETGPMLITHWGLSGPAILKLSSHGARELAGVEHKFSLEVDWSGTLNPETALEKWMPVKESIPKRMVEKSPRAGMPLRLWERLCQVAGLPPKVRWTDVKKKDLYALAQQLCRSQFQVTGKSTYKEEFVTAGGVDLKTVDFRSFKSKHFPGLYFAGEVLDIDALTGGFNFQAAWTGGWIAGQAMAESLA